jgi:hypothetical protein
MSGILFKVRWQLMRKQSLPINYVMNDVTFFADVAVCHMECFMNSSV